MNMIDAVKSALRQYVGFSGRARRSEYWYWILATLIAGIILAIIEGVMGLGTDGSGPLSTLFNLAIFLPGLAVTFRRLHDTGRSGWWIGAFYLGLILLVVLLVLVAGTALTGRGFDGAPAAISAVVGIILGIAFLVWAIALLVFLCGDSQVGPNKYGPNPKNEGNYDVFE